MTEETFCPGGFIEAGPTDSAPVTLTVGERIVTRDGEVFEVIAVEAGRWRAKHICSVPELRAAIVERVDISLAEQVERLTAEVDRLRTELAAVRETVAKKIDAKFITGELDDWSEGCGVTSRCTKAPRGWWCSRSADHVGPCAARPTWWNLRGKGWGR